MRGLDIEKEKWPDYQKKKKEREEGQERQTMTDKKLCLHCRQLISGDALYVLNQVAQRRGYCSWACLVVALDPEIVNKMLRDRIKDGLKRGRGRRRGHKCS